VQCLAAHLLPNSTIDNEYYEIIQDSAKEWIQFGPENGAGSPKLDIGIDQTGGENKKYTHYYL
jgi:hypothetical protein